jgi:hypothetical protein
MASRWEDEDLENMALYPDAGTSGQTQRPASEYTPQRPLSQKIMNFLEDEGALHY